MRRFSGKPLDLRGKAKCRFGSTVEDKVQEIFPKGKSVAEVMAVNACRFTIPAPVLTANVGLAAAIARLNWAKLVAWQTLFRRQSAYHPNVVIRAMPGRP